MAPGFRFLLEKIMHIRQFLDRPTASLSYLLACPDSRRAVMIDPVQDNLALYLGVLDEMKSIAFLKPICTLITLPPLANSGSLPARTSPALTNK